MQPPMLLVLLLLQLEPSFQFFVGSNRNPTPCSNAKQERSIASKHKAYNRVVLGASVAPSESEVVEWSGSGVAPVGTQLLISDIQSDGIALSAMFWNVVAQLQEDRTGDDEKKHALFAFPMAGPDFPLKAFSSMVNQDLGYLDLVVTVIADGPCPALLVDCPSGKVQYKDPSHAPAEMKRWVQDVIVDSRVCPYTQSSERAGTGVPGVTPGPVGYPVCDVVVGSEENSAAICSVLANFWNNCIELLNTPPSELSTILLCAPYVAVSSHEDFARVADAVLKTLQVVGANRYLSLVFFHPLYDRKLIAPTDRLTHGHLPPPSWLPSYLELERTESEIASISPEDLERANYQRRSPFFVINVLRADQVQKAESVVPWEVLEIDDGRRVKVSGARIYAQNTWRLATKSQVKTDPVTGYQYRIIAPKTPKILF